jgi:hypothetical protein
MAEKKSNFVLIPPSQYTGNQVILTSDRVLLNAKKDAVLIFAKQAIGFSSAGSIHFNSDSVTIINAPKIQLGINAEEPLLLGNKTVEFMTDFLKTLNQLVDSLSKVSVHIGDAKYPLYDVNVPAQDLTLKIQELLGKIEDLKSKQNYTI